LPVALQGCHVIKGRPLGRAIIDEDDLEIIPLRPKNAFDATRQEAKAVAGGNDDADLRLGPPIAHFHRQGARWPEWQRLAELRAIVEEHT